jgi:hypothetical protein
VAHKRVRGLYKGFKEGSGVPREGVIGVRIQGLKVGVKGRGSIQVYIRIYNF